MARQPGLVHIFTSLTFSYLHSPSPRFDLRDRNRQRGAGEVFLLLLCFSVFRFLFLAFVLLIELTGNSAWAQIEIRLCVCVCVGVCATCYWEFWHSSSNGKKLIDLSALKIAHKLSESTKREVFALIFLWIYWFILRCIKRSEKLAKRTFRSFESSLNLVCTSNLLIIYILTVWKELIIQIDEISFAIWLF